MDRQLSPAATLVVAAAQRHAIATSISSLSASSGAPSTVDADSSVPCEIEDVKLSRNGEATKLDLELLVLRVLTLILS